MRRTLLALTLAALFPLAAATAQDHPNFSGTWKINMTKSDPPPQRGGMQQMDMSKLMVEITQTADALTITESGMSQEPRKMTFYLDGRESTNAGPRGEMKSTSKWDGAKLVSNMTVNAQTQDGPRTFTSTETRELNKDGTEMTVTTTAETPRGQMTRKRVFDKQ